MDPQWQCQPSMKTSLMSSPVLKKRLIHTTNTYLTHKNYLQKKQHLANFLFYSFLQSQLIYTIDIHFYCISLLFMQRISTFISTNDALRLTKSCHILISDNNFQPLLPLTTDLLMFLDAILLFYVIQCIIRKTMHHHVWNIMQLTCSYNIHDKLNDYVHCLNFLTNFPK